MITATIFVMAIVALTTIALGCFKLQLQKGWLRITQLTTTATFAVTMLGAVAQHLS